MDLLVWCKFLILIVLGLYKCHASDTPIVGVLSQEAYLVRKAYPQADSFIAASYVKLLEAGGARVIPIWIGQNDDYYKRVVSYTNGIVFPGGGTYFNETGGYGEAARTLYNLSMEANDRGIHYPIWGICLGMQVLMFAELGVDIRADCKCKDVALPLQFISGYNQSKLFSRATPHLLDNIQTKNLTYNFHQFCLFEDDLAKHHILEKWTLLSKNKDTNQQEFISSMEHKKYPFYGIQFHPEKNNYEFKKPSGVPHSYESIEVAQYFGNFFVEECRRNNNRFPTVELENKTLIYNYVPKFSHGVTSYEQLYTFDVEDYKRLLL